MRGSGDRSGIDRLAGEEVNSREKKQRDLLALLLDCALNIFGANYKLAGSRPDDYQRFLRREAVMRNL